MSGTVTQFPRARSKRPTPHPLRPKSVLRPRVAWPRHVVIAVGVAALVGFILSPDLGREAQANEAPAPPTTRRLSSAGGPTGLSDAYRLPVTEVPPPPADLAPVDPEPVLAAVDAGGAAARAWARADRCPEVRAIVMGGDAPFAIVAHGGESALLHIGESKQLGGRWFKVRQLAPNLVTLRTGDDHTVPCPLQR